MRHKEQKLIPLLLFPLPRNGSSLPPRVPSLSSVINLLHQNHNPPAVPSHQPTTITYNIIALSYRGYWNSKGRPSQKGITLDAAAALAYARRKFKPVNSEKEEEKGEKEDVRLVLWGQSLGAGVVAVAAAADLSGHPVTADRGDSAQNGSDCDAEKKGGQGQKEKQERKGLQISGLLLETPFLSVRAMLTALYPEKWLPYRYLGPFLTNHWDSEEALRKIGLESGGGSAGHASDTPMLGASSSMKRGGRPRLLILQAGMDELVPKEHPIKLEAMCKEVGLDVNRAEIAGAFHTEVMAKAAGRKAVVDFLREIVDD